MKKTRAIEIAFLTSAAAVTVSVMLHAAGWSTDLGGLLFIVWAVSPYILLPLERRLLEALAIFPRASLISCAVSFLLLLLTLAIYVGTLGDPSSTYALIFIFAPLLLHAVGFSLLVLGLVVMRVAARRATSRGA